MWVLLLSLMLPLVRAPGWTPFTGTGYPMVSEQHHRVVVPTEATCKGVRELVLRDGLMPDGGYVTQADCVEESKDGAEEDSGRGAGGTAPS